MMRANEFAGSKIRYAVVSAAYVAFSTALVSGLYLVAGYPISGVAASILISCCVGYLVGASKDRSYLNIRMDGASVEGPGRILFPRKKVPFQSIAVVDIDKKKTANQRLLDLVLGRSLIWSKDGRCILVDHAYFGKKESVRIIRLALDAERRS